jgi:TonB family protein
MKFLLNLLFIVTPFLSIAQTSTEYYADRYLSKKSTEKKAKFILKNTDHPDGTNTKEVIRMSDNTIISRENFKGEEPIGIWIVSRNNKLTELNYDFQLVYDKQDNCAVDSNTFLPAVEIGQRDPLKDFDSVGYVAPIADYSRQDMMKQLYYPDKAIDDGLMGEVLIGFRISNTGEITSIRVLKGAHPLLDKEALRCYRLLKFRTSAFVNGVPKAICVRQKLNFRME